MHPVVKIAIFVIFTAVITFISYRSLINFRSHGFYRFFAWEFILILFLLNVDFWFVAPFSLIQIISWIFLFSSAYCVIEGYRLLRIKGNSDEKRPEKHLHKIEKTTHLVTDGIYHFIRHPLYASLLFLAWGIFCKSVSFMTFILVLGSSIFLFLTARIEEKENHDYFGEAYRIYMQRTKMFVPFVW
jgi:protein-S-isoprenylcysteine O-methyltransferase Ste14